MRRLLAILILCLPWPAFAAALQIVLTDPAGRALPDAVVSAYPVRGAMPPLRIAGPYKVAQQDVQFHPAVTIVPVGATVSFPNHDRFRHHVYSFSAPKRFELKLYGRDESHSILFDKPGTVALGCNIHDAMTAFVRVVDTPFAAKSGADGALVLTGLPPGALRLRVWHPRLKGHGNETEIPVTLPAAGLRRAIVLPVRPA